MPTEPTIISERKPIEVRDADVVELREDIKAPENGSAERESRMRENEADKRNADMYQAIHRMSTYLCSIKEDGEELAAGFQRIPNRRVLPDYFEVITKPVAFSTIRWKTQKKQYTSFSDFVRDVAQICHNAQVYNRPSAPIFGAAVRLREVFQKELRKLANKGDISEGDAQLPDLGDLPSAEESTSQGSEGEDSEGELENSTEDGDDDEKNDGIFEGDGWRRFRRRRFDGGRLGLPAHAEDKNLNDDHRKRGRPPVVLTSMEARITNLLNALHNTKDRAGNQLISPFKTLTDKTAVAQKKQEAARPLSFDAIMERAQQKKYEHVNQVLADLEHMFDNARMYSKGDSRAYEASNELRQLARALADEEKAKPENEIRADDGKLPLLEINHNGRTWKIGDWIHIRNPNDLEKPIVAQIFRIWQDHTGKAWINACWYYRPEQTVHRFEKHFFEREVVKTGQYRDHPISDVLDQCFVMFVTRFSKGRPRGVPLDKEIYVCESRYNEEKFRFSKIKAWTSCMPEEIRDKDYALDLFEVPRRIRKIPSPIKHLLREDSKETDDFPRPTWGSANAPPIVGAVHRRPRDSNESPPPEPSPPPNTAAAASGAIAGAHQPSSLSLAAKGTQLQFTGSGPSPSRGQYQASPRFQQPNSTPGGHPVSQTLVPIPIPARAHVAPPLQAPARPMQYQHRQLFAPNHPQSAGSTVLQQPMVNPLVVGYNHGPATSAARTAYAPTSSGSISHTSTYPQRYFEAFVLPADTNNALPFQLRQSFHHDSVGRVLFFTAPPLDRPFGELSPTSAPLRHSLKYLAGRQAWLVDREKKRKERDDALSYSPPSKKFLGQVRYYGTESVGEVSRVATRAVSQWFQRLDEETCRWRAEAGLEDCATN